MEGRPAQVCLELDANIFTKHCVAVPLVGGALPQIDVLRSLR